MENDVYYYEISIHKIEELEEAIVPNNIDVGYTNVLIMPVDWFKEPTIGERFILGASIMGRYFATSKVTEIINNNTFRTLNSIYEWNIVRKFK